jgi:hypothetical protein
MLKYRCLMMAAALATGLLAGTAPGSAQPLMLCGGSNLPPPLPIGSPCRWVCVREQLGPGSKMAPAPQRMVWRKVCARAPWSGAMPGGKAEIHRRNVPQLRKNRGPYD